MRVSSTYRQSTPVSTIDAPRALHLDRGAALSSPASISSCCWRTHWLRALPRPASTSSKPSSNSGSCPSAPRASHITQHKRDLAVMHERRQADRAAHGRRHAARSSSPLLCELVVTQAVRLHHTVHVEFPHQHDLGAERREVEVIAQRDGRVRTVAAGEGEKSSTRAGRNTVLELVQSGMRRAVGREYVPSRRNCRRSGSHQVAAVTGIRAAPCGVRPASNRNTVATIPHIAAHKPGVALIAWK